MRNADRRGRAVGVCFLLAAIGAPAAPIGPATVEWSFPIEGGSHPTWYPNESGPDSVVVSGATRLARLDGRGRAVWDLALDAPAATPATVADIDGDRQAECLVALADGTVLCVDASGRERWRHAFHTASGGFKNIVAADLLDENGLELLIGFDDGWLNCLSAHGKLLWRFLGDQYRVSPPAAGDVDGDGAIEIVYGTDNGHVYCLNGDGSVQWRYEELAPYGRSGPNLADLDGDGSVEVLITRSNVGNATCLMALNGADGRFLWRTRDIMQGYVSNATADLDGDGALETLHADKGNYLYCDNADGSRRWQVELDGHGIYWAPAVADLNGDGALDIFVGVRRTAGDRSTLYVVDRHGTVQQRIPLGGGANAAPALGDIDGDGELEAIVVTQSPDALHALTWHGGGTVAWPSLRGNSAMTANGNAPPGGPYRGERNPSSVRADLVGRPYPGTNEVRIALPDEGGPWSFAAWTTYGKEVAAETRVFETGEGARDLRAVWNITSTDRVGIRADLHSNRSGAPYVWFDTGLIRALPADECGFDETESACLRSIAIGDAHAADTAVLRRMFAELAAEREAVRREMNAKTVSSRLADQATALRANARRLRRLANALEVYWKRDEKGSFAVWHDANPWDRFDPLEAPAAFGIDAPIRITACRNEFEDAAVTLLNLSDRGIEVRCVFTEPVLQQAHPAREPELAERVTLRRPVPVASALAEQVFDALPELDLSRAIPLPPGEARQVWLTVDTRGLDAGAYELTLHLASLTKPMTLHRVPLRIEVWPIELPSVVFAKMNWSHFDPESASDQAIRDMIEHGISVIYGPPLPTIRVNARGKLAGKADWTAFDAALERVPAHFFLLWGGPPAREWPEGTQPAEDSDLYFAGFRAALNEMARHLESRGFRYDQWAFYPVDEPWNTGSTHVPHLRKFCEMVKRADPRVQNYANPSGGVRVEYVREFKDLIDVWQPEINILKRDPELTAWFHAHAKHFWAYEATGPAKDLLPLGYYRALGWLSWRLGLEGAGYWVYRGNDDWYPIEGGDWSAVYQSGAYVVPSRRWQADRDGVEDYRLFHVLRDEAVRARAAGHAREAEAAERLLDDAVERVVGWQIGTIDEITRLTRDYELDFELLRECRARIAQTVVNLKALNGRVNGAGGGDHK